MNGRRLQDRLYLGLGLSARQIGQSADAFRPSGPDRPLSPQNRFLRLPVAFAPAHGNNNRTNGYGDALWHGIFDASYTRPGDYLVLADANYFVASQQFLLPILCVKSNRIISIARPGMQSSTAGNPYGGYTSGGAMNVMEEWPASVLGDSRSSTSSPELPTDQIVPYWDVLLPAAQGIILVPGDLITDDLRRTAVIASSELTDLGWRISAKMALT